MILIGENPASHLYVKNKIAACAEVGIRSTLVMLPPAVPEHEVLAQIDGGGGKAECEAVETRRRGV